MVVKNIVFAALTSSRVHAGQWLSSVVMIVNGITALTYLVPSSHPFRTMTLQGVVAVSYKEMRQRDD